MEPKILHLSNAEEWYIQQGAFHERLKREVHHLIESALESSRIPYLYVTSRIKTKTSFLNKLDAKYQSSGECDFREVRDVVGVRIITLMRPQRKLVSDIVRALFEINPTESEDKGQSLAVDQVGYRSIHFVGRLNKSLRNNPAFSDLADSWFEIQICSILEHGWSEVEHDNNYKFKGVLPPDIQRRFKLLAGVIELADREFERLSEEIDQYRAEVDDKITRGDLEQPIDSVSLMKYCRDRFGNVEDDSQTTYIDDKIVGEVRDMEITTLRELDEVVRRSNYSSLASMYDGTNSDAGIIRDLLMIKDTAMYFGKAWKGGWQTIDELSLRVLEKAGVDIQIIKAHVRIAPDPY